jgi:hypothetical protein
LGVHGLNKSSLKTQPDRAHTHGLGRNFCSQLNSTITLVSDVDDREEEKFVHIKHECRIQSLATRRVDKRKNDLNVDLKTAH